MSDSQFDEYIPVCRVINRCVNFQLKVAAYNSVKGLFTDQIDVISPNTILESERLAMESLPYPADGDRYREDSGCVAVRAQSLPVVICDARTLVRQCLLSAAAAADRTTRFVGVADMKEWIEAGGGQGAAVVLLCLPAGHPFEAERSAVVQALSDLARLPGQPPLALLSDREVPTQIVEIIRLGVRGYIPTSASVEVTMRALQLVQAGGTYVPASSFCAAVGPQTAAAQIANGELSLFPPRQLSVARALRKGTPNKIIAYELNMCESTVKVHVRNIMKKLKARNRTEVAFLMNQHFEAEKQTRGGLEAHAG